MWGARDRVGFHAEPPRAAHPSEPPKTTPPGSIPPLPAGFKYHVFLTHDWGENEKGENNHEVVNMVNEYAKALGVITW